MEILFAFLFFGGVIFIAASLLMGLPFLLFPRTKTVKDVLAEPIERFDGLYIYYKKFKIKHRLNSWDAMSIEDLNAKSWESDKGIPLSIIERHQIYWSLFFKVRFRASKIADKDRQDYFTT